MIWISIGERWAISRIAEQDAANRYGQYLKALPIGENVYILSVFMEHLVDDYVREYKETIRGRKSIQKLYSKIIQEYEALSGSASVKDKQMKRMHRHLDEIETKLKENQSLLKQLDEYWVDANQTGMVTPEMGSVTLGGLKKSIDAVKIQIDTLESEATALKSEIRSKEEEQEKAETDANKRFYKYLNAYRHKIYTLYNATDRLDTKYERKLYYYWRSLIKKLNGIPLKRKTFSEICQERAVQVFKEDDLLHDQRKTINTKMKGLVGFEIEV